MAETLGEPVRGELFQIPIGIDDMCPTMAEPAALGRLFNGKDVTLHDIETKDSMRKSFVQPGPMGVENHGIIVSVCKELFPWELRTMA